MSNGVALSRLSQERKNWRKDHPFGFVAKPEAKSDGSVDFFRWKCLIPGKKNTDWEQGLYPVTLTFSEDYPSKPPLVYLPAGFFHPNVYESGRVCLSIINEDVNGSWKPSISVKQILEGVQALLDDPNNSDPAQNTAYQIYRTSRGKYREMVKKQARKYQAEGSQAR